MAQEDTEDTRQERRSDQKRTKADNFRSFITEMLPEKAKYANQRLKASLAGTTCIKVKNSDERYLLTWKEGNLIVEQKQKGEVELSSLDCEISATEATYLKIINGELNPQIAMLTDKIEIIGTFSIPIYIFNLFTVRSGSYA